MRNRQTAEHGEPMMRSSFLRLSALHSWHVATSAERRQRAQTKILSSEPNAADAADGICRQTQVAQDPMDHQTMDHHTMPQDSMDHSTMNMDHDQPATLTGTILEHMGSGTDVEPGSAPASCLDVHIAAIGISWSTASFS